MALYTFILEYEGGTYISQVHAQEQMEAPRIWATAFDLDSNPEYTKFFESDFRKKLVESLELDLVVELQGLINAYAWTAYRLEKPATIHFIETANR
jgi:hypothetical protein